VVSDECHKRKGEMGDLILAYQSNTLDSLLAKMNDKAKLLKALLVSLGESYGSTNV
jgi:hypothetical protein